MIFAWIFIGLLLGCVLGFKLGERVYKDTSGGTLYGKDARKFRKQFLENFKQTPEKLEKMKRDVELYENTPMCLCGTKYRVCKMHGPNNQSSI